MMMCFGDATKDQIERELAAVTTKNKDVYIQLLIIRHKQELISLLPPELNLESGNIDLYLTSILDTFIKRYLSKFDRFLSDKPASIDDETNPQRCEKVMSMAYKSLFRSYSVKNPGGDNLDHYFFAIVLGRFFLNQEIYYSIYTRNIFNQIRFVNNQDIGILILIRHHACCIFECGGIPKFYNDEDKLIHDCPHFFDLIRKLNDEEDLFVIPGGITKLNRTEYYNNIFKYSGYKRIRLLTVISKNNFGNNFNQEIKCFFSGEYDKVTNFYLLYRIGRQYYDQNEMVQALKFFRKGLTYEYSSTLYYYGSLYEKVNDLDNALLEYIKAFNNGSLEALAKIIEIYLNKGDNANAMKYQMIQLHMK
jgi:tetratricopeptide (TPR) repeat protein